MGAGHDSLQLTAIAAYFADRLRGGRLPGAPALPRLASRAEALAERARSASVQELARAIRQADSLGAGSRGGDEKGTEGGTEGGDPYAR